MTEQRKRELPPRRPTSRSTCAISSKERDVSPNTVKAYDRDLPEFVAFLGGYYGTAGWSWEGVDRLAMRGFLAHLSRRGAGKRTMARTLSGVRSFYRWMHRNEMVEANPARAVGAPKQDKYLPGYLDRAQIDLLFQMAEPRAMEGEFTDVRNLAILELFYSTGMRLSELHGLSRGDLDLVSQQVKVRGKGRKERIVPVGDHAVLALRNYEAKRDDLLRGVGAEGGADGVFPRAHGQADRRAAGAEGRVGVPLRDRRGRRPLGPLAAPHLRHAPPRRRRRSPRRPGAARPRVDLHDADLHPHERRAAEAGLPEGAPSGMKIA